MVDNGLGERGPGSGAEGRLELAEILEELVGLVERAKSMPLSSSAIIGREEVLELLNAARETLPTESSAPGA